MLQRWDFGIDKGTIMVIRDLCNTEINGNPGMFVAYQAKSGGAIYNLTWTTPTQEYNLYVKGLPDGDAAYDYLMAVAKTL